METIEITVMYCARIKRDNSEVEFVDGQVTLEQGIARSRSEVEKNPFALIPEQMKELVASRNNAKVEEVTFTSVAPLYFG